MNEKGLGMKNLSSMLTKQLKAADEKIKDSTSEHFDWENVKRAPQMFKQKAKIGFFTVDEEYDNYKDQLFHVEKRILTLSKYTRTIADKEMELFEVSKHIGKTVKGLFDPYHGLLESTKEQLTSYDFNMKKVECVAESILLSATLRQSFEEEYILWENTDKYIECINCIDPSVRSEFFSLVETLDSKLGDLLMLIRNIKKKIKQRFYAALDYDEIYNAHENLSIKQKTNEITIKQSHRLYNLERKLDESRCSYNSINDILKKELPYFFKLVDLILQPVRIKIYYVQLIAAYQFNMNTAPLSEVFKIDVRQLSDKDFPFKLIGVFNGRNKPVIDSINLLSITNFNENYLNGLIEKGKTHYLNTDNLNTILDTNYEYCQALYSFKGAVEGDLPINQGDLIKIIDRKKNWWKGECNGKTGIFPGNYVKLLT